VIKLCTVNIQCVRNKVQQLELLFEEHNLDFVCVSEHWLVASEIEFYRTLSNSNLVAYFCRESPWGGVAVYARSGFRYSLTQIDLSQFCEEVSAEFAGMLIPELSMVVVTMYRSPSGNMDRFLHLLELCLTVLLTMGMHIVIGTDHNINLLWTSHKTTAFLNLLRGFNFYCATTDSTRGNSSLDTFLTNLDRWCYDVSVSATNWRTISMFS